MHIAEKRVNPNLCNLQRKIVQNAEMEQHERLRQARIAAGFSSAAEAARRLGVSYGTYSGHENGSRGIKNRDLYRYAQAFSASVDWLIFGHENSFMKNCIIIGFAEAGHIPDGQVEFFDKKRKDEGIILPPYVPKNSGYIKISGEYLHGIADPGWIIICETTFHEMSDNYIEKICLCRTQEGKMYIRRITESGIKGLFNLESPHSPTIKKVSIAGVSSIFLIVTDTMLDIIKDSMPEVIKIMSDTIDERAKKENS